MAIIWFNDGSEWRSQELGGAAVRLSDVGPELSSALSDHDAHAVLVAPYAPDRWVVLAGAETRVRVNGLPMAGIHVLSDRDEVRVWSSGGLAFFYSSERKASIEPYEGQSGAVCPRCQQGIGVGDPAVRCPRCGVWHHETEALGCWTYDARCAVCSDATQLNAPYRWQPEDLWARS
jgi:hypothetical protein